MSKEIIIETIKIVFTSLLTSFFTYQVAFRKEKVEKMYKINMKLIEQVYAPILKEIEETIQPGDCYNGIPEYALNQIIQIVDDNYFIADPKLKSFIWSFKEDILYTYRNECYEDYYDDNEKFYNYIRKRYNYLRKKVYLQYNKEFFGLTGILYRTNKKFNYKPNRFYRRIIRCINLKRKL